MLEKTLTVILAGGPGLRLHPLTNDRPKPAVPFGGKYRIIDFTLANCLHSGLRRILVLTQYKSHSLQKHLRDGWSIFNPELGEYITPVPPQMFTGEDWYAGTADAVYQNLKLLERSGADRILVLYGDHIYRMDYAAMLRFHLGKNADLTIACIEAPLSDALGFGVMELEGDRIVSFKEKPAHQAATPQQQKKVLASIGIYVFSLRLLLQILHVDHEDQLSSHDFGKDIIPKLVTSHPVYAYRFGGKSGRVSRDKYWRAVGTIDSYYESNMDLLSASPPIALYQPDWPIRTYQPQNPPVRTVPGARGSEGIFINSIAGGGVVIAGGSVQHSILFPQVYIGDEATVYESLLLNGVKIGAGARLQKCIVDKDVEIPAGERIGYDKELDRARFAVSEKGIVVVPKGYKFD